MPSDESSGRNSDELKELQERLVELETANTARIEAQAASEKAEAKSGDRYDRHLRTITIVLSVAALVIALFGTLITWLARQAQMDSQRMARDMRSDVRDAIAQMNSDFAKLAGDSLKKPKLEILNYGTNLNGVTIDTSIYNSRTLEFSFKNVGQRKTEELAIRLFTDGPVNLPMWTETETKEPGFHFVYRPYAVEVPVNVPAGDVAPFSPLQIMPRSGHTNISCKLRVYYGGVEPAEAVFRLGYH